MFRRHGDADISSEYQDVPHVTRCRLFELNVQSQVVNSPRLFRPASDIARSFQLVVVREHVDGEGNILCRERHAIGPLNAFADLDRHATVAIVVLKPRREPWNELTVKHVEVEQPFGCGLVHPGARESA